MSIERTKMCEHCGVIGEIGRGGQKPNGWWFSVPRVKGGRHLFYDTLACKRADDAKHLAGRNRG